MLYWRSWKNVDPVSKILVDISVKIL